MLIQGKHYHTIWENTRGEVQIIDQRFLPFELKTPQLKNAEDTFKAIEEMWVRGAPLIGVTAAYGMYLEAKENKGMEMPKLKAHLKETAEKLLAARPTAINLKHAIDRCLQQLTAEPFESGTNLAQQLLEVARALKNQEIENSRKIGWHGVKLIEKIAKKKKGPVNILTHCNAGWLACIDYGTAIAPIYEAQKRGIAIHVWVDETRPRNQGARLTLFELEEQGISCSLIADNTGGLLMQKGMVDLCIVGSDRTAANGDVANKIGTYLKALAAKDNGIPFYVALPESSFDLSLKNGGEIPIEERSEEEVTHLEGLVDNKIKKLRITTENARVKNYGFDVTPAHLVTKLITEKGICTPNEQEIRKTLEK